MVLCHSFFLQFNNFDVPGIDAVDSSVNEFVQNESFVDALKPERVRQRVKAFKYEGDPDLAPIRSDENQVLVRILYAASNRLNINVCTFTLL